MNKEMEQLIAEQALKNRALGATAEGITISDVRQPDQPIIYANTGFERLTGYSAKDILGKNCRFLQGEKTDRNTVAEIGRAIRESDECAVELLNYRKDGTPFWNRLSVTPVLDGNGKTTHYIGVQSDISKLKQVEEELRRAKADLENAYRELKRDLDAAARIQRSLLPTAPPEMEGFDFAWKYLPCAELAGDFLNVFRLDESRLGFYVLDVVGHGAAAALLSVSLSRWLSPTGSQSLLWSPLFEGSTEYRITPPAKVAERLNDQLFMESSDPQYFTMIYGVLDIETRELRYVSAGHPGPLHLPYHGRARLLDSTSVPVGMLEAVEYHEGTLKLQAGDRLFLFTDGLTESMNPDGQEFGDDLLIRKLHCYEDLEITDAIGRLMKDVEDWRGPRPMRDDTSILGMEVRVSDRGLREVGSPNRLARSA